MTARSMPWLAVALVGAVVGQRLPISASVDTKMPDALVPSACQPSSVNAG